MFLIFISSFFSLFRFFPSHTSTPTIANFETTQDCHTLLCPSGRKLSPMYINSHMILISHYALNFQTIEA